MRPPSHMPLPAMMMAPDSMRLMRIDCSAVWLRCRLGSVKRSPLCRCTSAASRSTSSRWALYAAVAAVAIGALHDHEVRVRHRRGVAQDRRTLVAEIAAEHELAPHTLLLEPQLDDGRTQDVARVAQPALHAIRDIEHRVVVHRAKIPQCGLRLLCGIARFDEGQVFALTLAVVPFGVLLVEKARVLEQDAREVAARAVGVDGAAVAGLDQQGQTPGMIEVRVAHDHRIEPLRIERKGLAVVRLVVGLTLHETAIDQHAPRADFVVFAGARDLARRAVKGDAHQRRRPRLPGGLIAVMWSQVSMA